MDAPSVAIAVERFSLWYGDFRALQEVTAQVPHGKVTGLIGPSGCGKSTLLRSLNRMNERFGNVRTEGSITVEGHDVMAPDVSLASLRKEVGMVFQRPNPLPISIFENVVFGLRSHLPRNELSRERLQEAVESSLTRVGLWDVAKDRLNGPAIGLSLEQQQKLCIARLLPLKPRVILMDEPCSALDAQGTAQIEGLIAELKASYTLVIVTHSMAQARRVSDECVFMYLGQIVEHRPTAELFGSPKDPRTASYVEGRHG